MATYTTNLSTITLCQDTTGFSELAAPHSSGSTPASSTENYIQDGNAVDQATGQGDNQDSGMQFIGSALTWTAASNWVVIGWTIYASPTNLKDWSTGGFRIGIGSSANNHDLFNAMGNNFGNYPYGGWQSTAIDPEFATADQTIGTATGTYAGLAFLPNVTVKITKGSPIAVDAWRYGRGDIVVTGTASTFTGMATANDATTAKWGLFQASGGTYLWKGLMSLGTSGASVTFSDANKVIRIDDTPRILAGFNAIEITHASSSVTWDTITFLGVETSITGSAPISAGDFEMIDDATFAATNCSFTDMGTFIFDSNSTLALGSFNRCGLITGGAAVFDGVTFIDSEASATIIDADLVNITDCSFESDGSNHAVELTTIGSGTMSWDGNFLTGYAAGSTGSPVTPTSTGNEAIYVNVATASDLTINVAGGADIPSIRVGASFTGDVNVVASTNVTISGLRDNTEIRVMTAGTDTELTGIEDATTGTTDDRSYTFALSAGTSVDIFIINITYENIEIYAYEIPSSDADLPQQQRFDRVYLNP